jgi:hypothetical protein
MTVGAKRGAWWARMWHTCGTPIWVWHVATRVCRACEACGWFIWGFPSDNATEPEADLRPVGNQHGRASRLYGRLDRKGVVGPGISTSACGRHAAGSEASDRYPRDAGSGDGCGGGCPSRVYGRPVPTHRSRTLVAGQQGGNGRNVERGEDSVRMHA